MSDHTIDFAKPNPDSHQSSKDKPAGSLFILNNASFSGADIKVVVTIYDNGKAGQEYITQYENEIKTAATEQYNTIGEISRISSKLNSIHEGTEEGERLTRRLAQLRQRSDELTKVVPALEAKARSIKKDSPTASTKVLAEVQTLSISIHRDKQAVYACGRVYPTGYTRGPRALAGSMIFTVFNEHVLYEFLSAHSSDFDAMAYTSALLDQLPPVDIVVAFANEYGQLSRMAIYGVEFVNEGQTMSIEDIITENVVNFVARDIDPMRTVAHRKIDQNSVMVNDYQPMRASDLLLEEDYKAIKDSLSPFSRARRRKYPFL